MISLSKRLLVMLCLSIIIYTLAGCAGDESNHKEVTIAQKPEQVASPRIFEYSLINEDIYDAPIKTQIEQSYVITDKLTKEQIESFMIEKYDILKARTGFKYHKNPTAVYIYLFESKEHYESKMGQQFASLLKDAASSNYSINIDENRLESFGEKPEPKNGLSEEKRKQIFIEIVKCEDWAKGQSGYNNARTLEEMKCNAPDGNGERPE